MNERELIRFECHTCGKHLRAPVEKAGRQFSCPKCTTALVVPSTVPKQATVLVVAPAAQPTGPELPGSDPVVLSSRRLFLTVGGILAVLTVAFGVGIWQGVASNRSGAGSSTEREFAQSSENLVEPGDAPQPALPEVDPSKETRTDVAGRIYRKKAGLGEFAPPEKPTTPQPDQATQAPPPPRVAEGSPPGAREARQRAVEEMKQRQAGPPRGPIMIAEPVGLELPAVGPLPVAARNSPEKADPADPYYVWHHLAALSSFPSERNGLGPTWGEALYLPHQSRRMRISPGPYGTALDMLFGQSPGAAQTESLRESLFQQYDRLGTTTQPYLRQAVGEFYSVCRARIQLAEADDQYGNTPSSSLREFQKNIFLPGLQYAALRGADEAELRERLERAYPNHRVIIDSAPMSPESQEKLGELLLGVSGMRANVSRRAVVSALLAFADMAQIEREIALWRTWLLPLAKRCSGPAANKPLLEFEVEWGSDPLDPNPKVKLLNRFLLRNVSGQDLTHAVVQLVCENEWGDRAPLYYYFERLSAGEVVGLMPPFRWHRYLRTMINTVKFESSVWTDQYSELDRRSQQMNPMPIPDQYVKSNRKNILSEERQYRGLGESLGDTVRATPLLPIVADRQRLRLVEMTASGQTFAVRLTENGGSLGVSFRHGVAHVEANVFDLISRRPVVDKPNWKGQMEPDRDAGYVLRFDSGWTVKLGHDDRLLATRSSGNSNDLRALMRVRLP